MADRMTKGAAAAMPSTHWVARPGRSPSASLRMFCFPYAGVGASAFRTWHAAFPPHVELCLVQPPGREARWAEKPFDRVGDFASSAAEALAPFLTVPFVFFGHSLGSLVSFELARELRRRGLPGPIHMFVSAHRAPHLPHPHPPLRHLADSEFIRQLCDQYGGIPQAVLDNRDLLELMLPCLRADFNAFETYQYIEEAPLSCSMSAFGGRQDRRIQEAELAGWRQQTAGSFKLRMFDGNHFFLQGGRDALLAAILGDLEAVGVAPAGR
jgi:surfactin synthase thioesterase subunit